MLNSYSDHPDLNAIFDDEPTEPFIMLSRDALKQLDADDSVIAEFTARAQMNGYSTEADHWTTRLSNELDYMPVDEIDILAIDEYL